MKRFRQVLVICILYYGATIIVGCCDSSDAVLNGNILSVELFDADPNPESINNDEIKTGFRLVYFPDTDFVYQDFQLVNAAYGSECDNNVINSILESSVSMSFSKDITIDSEVFPANTNILDYPIFSSIKFESSCPFTMCEMSITFPSLLVLLWEVEPGDFTISFSAQTDDGVVFNHDYDTKISL